MGVGLTVVMLFPPVAEAEKFVRKKEAKNVESELGLNIPKWGVAIDAVYDSRLDNLVPGYKILNVVLTNRSAQMINFDVEKDKWILENHLGKDIKGINHLYREDKAAWSNLPAGLKEKLAYPGAVRVGKSTNIDLIFPAHVELTQFKQIRWKSAHFKREFNLNSNFEKNTLMEDDNDGIDISTPSYRQSLEKYKTEGILVNGQEINLEEKAVEKHSHESPMPNFDPRLDERL